MTHMPDKPVPGDMKPGYEVSLRCRKCPSTRVLCEPWESSCGGWEDYRYTCKECGHTWWVDGIDS